MRNGIETFGGKAARRSPRVSRDGMVSSTAPTVDHRRESAADPRGGRVHRCASAREWKEGRKEGGKERLGRTLPRPIILTDSSTCRLELRVLVAIARASVVAGGETRIARARAINRLLLGLERDDDASPLSAEGNNASERASERE